MGNGLITGITAITALIATIINLIGHLGSVKKSKEARREDNYYHKVLRPYLKKVHESPNNNKALDLFNEIDVNEPFIPPYIRYVYYNTTSKDERNDKLNKLLIIDYIKMYENENRAISRFFKVADRVEKIIMIILSAAGFTSVVGVGISILFFTLPQSKMWENYEWIVITIIELILASIAVGCFFVLMYYANLDKDMYSTQTSKINKQIKNLDSEFIKISSKNYY